jgi:hypothetical protein
VKPKLAVVALNVNKILAKVNKIKSTGFCGLSQMQDFFHYSTGGIKF